MGLSFEIEGKLSKLQDSGLYAMFFFCNWIKDLTMSRAGRAFRHLNMFSLCLLRKVRTLLSCPSNSTEAECWNAWNTPMPFCDMLRMKMMKSEGPGAFFAGAIPRCVQDWGWVGTSHSRFNSLPWQTGQKSKHACQWTAINSCLKPSHLT